MPLNFFPILQMSVVNVTGYDKLPSNQYAPVMDALANRGPISISVEASEGTELFHNPSSAALICSSRCCSGELGCL